MSYPRLGITNVLPAESKTVYSRVPGRGSVGRIADLFSHTAKHEFKAEQAHADAFGILAHALLDGIFMIAQSASIHVEAAMGAHDALIAARFSIADIMQDRSLQKGVESWIKECWARVEIMGSLRGLLRQSDRIEIRYNLKLKLVEWRVVRKIGLTSVESEQASMVIIEDPSDRIYQGSDQAAELSEMPFEKWLEEVYRANTKNKSSSGEIYFQGESLQNEEELSRVITNREKITVEDSVKLEMHGNCWEDGVENLELKSIIDAENEQRVDQKADEILSAIDDIKDERAKQIVLDSKRRELRAKHDVIVGQRKIEKYEKLLQEKEKNIQKKLSEIRVLNQKVLGKSTEGELSETAVKFRDKAVQMAEALKRAKEDNEALERMIFELRQRSRIEGDDVSEIPANLPPGGMTVAQQQVEDLLKKVDRLNRALEAEKGKVKSFSERATVAEKEAQASGPIIEDLEKKVEHTLKVAQQHKKETEQVKQKLVQADAEKNKIKNELVKAQAQIQTLMKRQAS